MSKVVDRRIDEWIRRFVNQFDARLADAGRRLSSEASEFELRQLAVRSMLATLVEDGLAPESTLELLGAAALERTSANVTWNDALNERRFSLIDKDIQGTLTPAESIELAGLTQIMRASVESEARLPMKGARALHRKLLESTGTSD